MANEIDFDRTFLALTSNEPFPWQQEFYGRLVSGHIPESCDIPTGLGKTAVIPIWLIALAQVPKKLPRRLVYIVNRRTVVDQATREAEKLRNKLCEPTLKILTNRLQDLCSISPKNMSESPLAISTLRGQFADNAEWRANPARPAVVIGTIDMIGSRLLFSGYGCGFKARPLHAGFLGQDSLVIHDEAHLEPAFQDLLEAIRMEQHDGCFPDFRPMHIMELTATTRGQATSLNGNEKPEKETIELSAADRKHPIVNKRINAMKGICLIPLLDDKKAAKTIATQVLKRAEENPNSAILVYSRNLNDVQIIADELKRTMVKQKNPDDVVLTLTGTLRGLERDALVQTPVFQRFLPPPNRNKDVEPAEGTVFLVCTSAGEVGIDISADHMVCDLTPFDSMAQRLGRVNRFGNGNALIDVFYPEDFSKGNQYEVFESRQAKTLELLKKLPKHMDGRLNASPQALSDLPNEERIAAFSPEPIILKTSDILFDTWSLTTIRGMLPGRPTVEPYLHGIRQWELPETHVAWREEVEVVTGVLLEKYQPEDLLDDYPLKPRELLRDRSDRVFENLQMLASKHLTEPVWVVDEQGNVTILSLAELADPSATSASAKRPLIGRIEDGTVLLPPIVGGLRDGMLDGKSTHAKDISSVDTHTMEKRIRLWSDDAEHMEKTKGMRLVRTIALKQDDDEEEPRMWEWYKNRPLEDSRTAQGPVQWSIHIRDTVCQTEDILAGLSLPQETAQAVLFAAKMHDHGKRRSQFQSMLGNLEYPELVLAKSGRTGANLPELYRHEFGSIADAIEDSEFQELSPIIQDLVLHLIASHHGRARPHFPPNEVFDPAPGRAYLAADLIACEVPRRFVMLQQKYGRWGLAYIESLLRAADWTASANPSEFITTKNDEL